MNKALQPLYGVATSLAGSSLVGIIRLQDSRTPGFVQPFPPPPDDDLGLDLVLQAWIVGLTGLPGNLVRPRWQPAPPPMPDQGVNWCAVGILNQVADDNEWSGHFPSGGGGLGVSMMQRHEELEGLASFYGTAASGYAGLVRDNSQIDQNRDILDPHGIQFVSAGEIRIVPDLINQIWVRRADITVSMRRQITRTYPLRTVLDAPSRFADDQGAPDMNQNALPLLVSSRQGPPLMFVEMQAQWTMGAEVVDGRFFFAFNVLNAGSISALDHVTATGAFAVSVAINGVPVPGLFMVVVGPVRGHANPAAPAVFVPGDQITGVVTGAAGAPTDAVLNLNVTWS